MVSDDVPDLLGTLADSDLQAAVTPSNGGILEEDEWLGIGGHQTLDEDSDMRDSQDMDETDEYDDVIWDNGAGDDHAYDRDKQGSGDEYGAEDDYAYDSDKQGSGTQYGAEGDDTYDSDKAEDMYDDDEAKDTYDSDKAEDMDDDDEAKDGAEDGHTYDSSMGGNSSEDSDSDMEDSSEDIDMEDSNADDSSGDSDTESDSEMEASGRKKYILSLVRYLLLIIAWRLMAQKAKDIKKIRKQPQVRVPIHARD